jgi:hypothetical protein
VEWKLSRPCNLLCYHPHSTNVRRHCHQALPPPQHQAHAASSPLPTCLLSVAPTFHRCHAAYIFHTTICCTAIEAAVRILCTAITESGRQVSLEPATLHCERGAVEATQSPRLPFMPQCHRVWLSRVPFDTCRRVGRGSS